MWKFFRGGGSVDVRLGNFDCCTRFAFAALKANRSVVSWGRGGEDRWGNNIDLGYGKVQHQTVDVRSIYVTRKAFAAINVDGTVVA